MAEKAIFKIVFVCHHYFK